MGLFSRSKTGKEVHGTIGYFKLTEWWLSEFSEVERDHIVNTFSPMGGSDRSLVEGHCLGHSQSVEQYLTILSSWFNNAIDRSIAVRILKKAEEITLNDYNIHNIFVTSGIGVREYYRNLGYKLNDPYMSKHL